MLKVGVTGGIASGKSTLAKQFAGFGIVIADADLIARNLTASGNPGLSALRAALGDSILNAEGELDRARMRRRLFADAELRKRIEVILHPLVIEELARQLAAAQGPYCLAVVPLLAETAAARALVDRILVVDCSEQTQLARLMSRDGENESSARAMLAAQLDRTRRLAAGDDILVNETGLAPLQDAVRQLHTFYLELAAQQDYRRAGLRLP